MKRRVKVGQNGIRGADGMAPCPLRCKQGLDPGPRPPLHEASMRGHEDWGPDWSCEGQLRNGNGSGNDDLGRMTVDCGSDLCILRCSLWRRGGGSSVA